MAAPLTAEQQARKWCKDYGVPPSECAGLVECAKQRGWAQCAVAIGGAVAAGACAAYLTPAMAPVCGAAARWILGLIGTEGTITRSCYIPSVRTLTTDDVGTTPSRWLDRTLDELNVGEFAVLIQDKLDVKPMYFVDCGEKTPEELVFDASQLMDQRGRGNVFVAKDWDGTRYKVVDDQLVREGPIVLMHMTTLLPIAPPGGWPPGAVAVYDSAINKYRILAPTE